MTNQIIDNNISTDIKKSIIWQYDNAQKLLAIIKLFSDYAESSTEDLWDKYRDLISIFDNPEAQNDNFALALWGIILGIERPSWTNTTITPNVTAPISNELYFKILKANFHLYNSRFSTSDIVNYLDELGLTELGYRVISDGQMAMQYELAEGYTYPRNEIGYLMEHEYFDKYPAAVQDNSKAEFIPGFIFGFREQALSTIIKEYADSDTWNIGDFCFYKRGIYKCTTSIQSQEAFNPSKWTLVDAKLYYSTITYSVGDKCKVGQKVFNCVRAINTPVEFTQSVTSGGTTITYWEMELSEYDNVDVASYDGIHFDKYVQVDFVGDVGARTPYWGLSNINPHTKLAISDQFLSDAGDGTGIGTAFYKVFDEDYDIGAITIDYFKRSGLSPTGIRFAYNMDIPRIPPKNYIFFFEGTGFPTSALYKNGLSSMP